MCHPEVPPGTIPPDVRVEEVAIAVAGGRMPALVAYPERLPAPAVLVVNDVYGRAPFYDDLSRRIAQAGFLALDPEYFFREGTLAQRTQDAAMARRAKLDQRRTLDDLAAAAAWLRARSDVRGARLGSVGFCMGGTLVLDLAARDPSVATVCYYGFPVNRAPSPLSPPQPIDVAPKMKGPLIGFWGDQDAGVGMDNVKALDAELTRSGVAHDFHVYPGLAHGFLAKLLDSESAPGHEQACDSWGRAIRFWRESLS